MPILKIVGFRTGTKSIYILQTFRMELVKSIVEARIIINKIHAGKNIEFEISEDEKLHRVAKSLHKSGLIVEIQ